MAEEVQKIDSEEVLEDTVVDNNSDELSFFKDTDQPREGFEEEEEIEADQEETETGEEPPKISETSEEDEQYFKMAMGFLDQSRAMGLSLFFGHGMDKVDDYTYYSDWNDPKHKATLEAGRVVAKKWKLSTFQNLPEFMLLLSIVVSTAALFKKAKDDKKAREEEEAKQAQISRMEAMQKAKAQNNEETITRQLKPFSKAN